MRQFFNKDVNYSILLNLKKKIYSHLPKKKNQLNQAHKFDFFNVKKNKNGKEGTFVTA